MLSLFEETVLRSSVSFQIKRDKDDKNILLREKILQLRGSNCGAILQGYQFEIKGLNTCRERCLVISMF